MTETRTRQHEASEEKLPAQYINYVVFTLDPMWRRLTGEERERGKREFMEAAEEHSAEMLLRSFSLMAHRAQALPGKEQHGLLLRDRRLRVHPIVRGRVAREIPGPDDGAQGERGERLHGARHPHLHLPAAKPTRNSAKFGIVAGFALEIRRAVLVYSFTTHQPWPGGIFLASRSLRCSGFLPSGRRTFTL